MAYDIYGNKLAEGHCEVHPHVAEPYPCSLCYAESEMRKNYQQQTDPREAEYYAEMERAHYEDIAKKSSLLYRILCYMIIKVNYFNGWLEKCKEKILNRIKDKSCTN